jgi:phage FluMu protein Com
MGQPLRALPEASSSPAECRCLCGSLLARLVEGGVELKCRRCKRAHVVPLGENSSHSSDRAHEGRRS